MRVYACVCVCVCVSAHVRVCARARARVILLRRTGGVARDGPGGYPHADVTGRKGGLHQAMRHTPSGATKQAHDACARCDVRVGLRKVPAQMLARKSPVPMRMWDEGEPPCGARADVDTSPGAEVGTQESSPRADAAVLHRNKPKLCRHLRSCGGKRYRFMGIRELLIEFSNRGGVRYCA